MKRLKCWLSGHDDRVFETVHGIEDGWTGPGTYKIIGSPVILPAGARTSFNREYVQFEKHCLTCGRIVIVTINPLEDDTDYAIYPPNTYITQDNNRQG